MTHPGQGPLARRAFLRLGGLGALSLEDLIAGRRAAASTSDTSVILLYLHGGPSHLETFDLKPDAPTSHRSVFPAIETRVSGMSICEHLPLLAKQAHRFSLLRSLHHDVNIHSDGGITVLTGKRPEVLDPTSQSKSLHPDLGHVAGAVRSASVMPQYVAIPQAPYMTRPAYLGPARLPLVVQAPHSGSFRPAQLSLVAGKDAGALENRRRLLARVDTFRREQERDALAAHDAVRGRAFQMLASPEVAAAFDLAREPDALRDRYGRHLWGQGCLLARRLAAAGTGVVSLFIDSPMSGQEYTNWDDHILNAGRPGHFAGFLQRRLVFLDQALSALIEDLYDRGLDRKVLVAVFGEFGRTPRLSSNANGTGRDHWPDAYSALVSGGGMRMGQVVGATDAKGEYPADRPLTPGDLLATLYRHLGIDPARTFEDRTGKPVPILPEGELIRELS